MHFDVENPTKLPLLHHKWEKVFKAWWRQGRSVSDRFIDLFRSEPHFKFATALCSSTVRTKMREVRAYFLLDFAHSPTRIDTLHDEIEYQRGAWEWPDTAALGYREYSVQDHVGVLLSKLGFVSDRSRRYFDLFGDGELKEAVRKIQNLKQPAQNIDF
ncbi:hypothetical protein FAGAP_11929 [Fusarium agapanthi]|uniref:Uncharacterized protein n=1 Tax=Fusarium agapanthi TaxID=1803897 RepID=A0A9P5E999_9HYPO|nr:hypothetical protein FAGAP_11929 [Fusarium agapanthi]